MRTRTQPKGAVVFKVLLVALFTVLAGGIVGGLLACAVGLICSQGGGGGGGGGTIQVAAGDPCSSTPNACGQTNTGFYVADNNCPAGSDQSGGGSSPSCMPTASCNATPPDNTTCPAPTIPPTNGFTASPTTVGKNGNTVLTWATSNTTSCRISGDNGYTSSGGPSGSAQATALAQTTMFTLTCEDGPGGPTATRSIKVIVDPHFKEI